MSEIFYSAWRRLWAAQAKLDPYTFTLVRIVTGANLIPHGAQKLFGWFGGKGLAVFAVYLDQHGIEPSGIFSVYVGSLEFFGGLLLVLGLGTRLISVQLIGFMTVAVVAIHWPRGFFWTDKGFEYPLMWAVLGLVLLVHGPGRLSLDNLLAGRLPSKAPPRSSDGVG